MASMLTSAPSRSSISKSGGMAVISLLLPSTATWPNVRLASVAQALTKCNGPHFEPAEPHSVLPSMAMWPRPNVSVSARSQATALQGTRLQFTKDAFQGVVRRHAVGQCQEPFEPGQAFLGKEHDFLPV